MCLCEEPNNPKHVEAFKPFSKFLGQFGAICGPGPRVPPQHMPM